MDQQTGVQQETRTQITQGVGLLLVGFLGAAAAASFLFFGSQKQTTTTSQVTTTTNTNTSKAVDLTNAKMLTTTTASTNDYDGAYAETAAIVQASDVTITITSPADGAIVNDESGNFITAELNDPNHRVSSLYVRTFNDRYKIMVGWYNVSTAPYRWNTALSMYPSGEYRDVIYARDASGNFIAWKDVMYTKSHDCYYLGYPDLTLTAPTTAITSGQTFTMTAKVKNNIRGACQNLYDVTTNGEFGSGSLLPDGWTSTADPAGYVPLGIGETKTFTVSVKVPATTATGAYTVGATTNRMYTGLTTTKSTTVNVTRPSGGGGGPLKIPE